MGRFPGARKTVRSRDRDFIDEPPSCARTSAAELPRCLLARLAGEPEADRHRDAALDGHAVPARRDEAPALAHRRHGRLVERREAGGADHAHIRRAPVGRDQNLEEDDALLPEPARHQRVRRGGGRARGDARPPPARPPPPPPPPPAPQPPPRPPPPPSPPPGRPPLPTRRPPPPPLAHFLRGVRSRSGGGVSGSFHLMYGLSRSS